MPIYEYRCPEGHLFERFHRMSDPGPDACDVCGAAPVEIVLYPVAVHFKGSGFYTTDYGRGSKKRDAAREGDSSASADGAGEKPKEAKPEKTAAADKNS